MSSEEARLRTIVFRHGGTVSALGSGARRITWDTGNSALERASRAALCGLALARELPGRHYQLVSGHDDERPMSRPHSDTMMAGAVAPVRVAPAPPGRVWIDDVTASLLRGRFGLHPLSHGHLLEAAASGSTEHRRRVLGRDVPCVGRRSELALLSATLEEVVDEHVARAVLLVGPAGIGKSRVMEEFARRLEAPQPLRLHMAATPLTAESAGGLLRQALLAALPTPLLLGWRRD